MKSHRVLIIDADINLTELLTKKLTQEKFEVSVAHDGQTGLKKAQNSLVDVIVLDIILPKMNGFEVLKMIRVHQDTPILILTARSDEIDTILGYNLGADNYLLKPCSMVELITRLRSLLKLSEKMPIYRSVIQYHGITVDSAKRLVHTNGIGLELTNAEFNILETLIKSPTQAFSKEELTEYALGRKYTAYDRSIDVHISNLRNKLGDKPDGLAWIKTVRGFGYLLG